PYVLVRSAQCDSCAVMPLTGCKGALGSRVLCGRPSGCVRLVLGDSGRHSGRHVTSPGEGRVLMISEVCGRPLSNPAPVTTAETGPRSWWRAPGLPGPTQNITDDDFDDGVRVVWVPASSPGATRQR